MSGAEHSGADAEVERTLGQARELALAGLVVALGIVVPVLFHAVGSGPVFLPMHLPVLAGGMLLSVPMAALVGAVTPLASAALTGMPPISPPIAFFMAFELAGIASAASLLHRTARLNPWLATLGAICCGRAIYALELFAAAPLLGVKLPAAAAGVLALAKGWPGLVLQVAIVPGVVAAIERKRGR